MPESEKSREDLLKKLEAQAAEIEFLRTHAAQMDGRDRQALREEARMEATSILASGIGHEFNNLMLGVLGNASLLRKDLGEGSSAVALLDDIERSAKKADGLAQQMLAFARQGKYQPQATNLNEAVHRAVHYQEGDLPEGVTVERNLDDSLWSVIADPTQMSQVVMNLYSNALAAVGVQGRVIVTTRNLVVNEISSEEHGGIVPGHYVLLTMEDDGRGIEDEDFPMIFEPFFSTQPQGRGLGLAAVKSIVGSHNGQILVDSEPGAGAVFRLYFPVVKPGDLKTEDQPKEYPGGTETILIVDDEPVVLGVTREILERLGYKVMTAQNGKEAVAIARLYDGKIHLTVLDLGMPVMSGQEVFPFLKEARPDMKVVISSGFSMDRVAQSLMDTGADAFVQKPFQLAAFAPKIREVLDAE